MPTSPIALLLFNTRRIYLKFIQQILFKFYV